MDVSPSSEWQGADGRLKKADSCTLSISLTVAKETNFNSLEAALAPWSSPPSAPGLLGCFPQHFLIEFWSSYRILEQLRWIYTSQEHKNISKTQEQKQNTQFSQLDWELKEARPLTVDVLLSKKHVSKCFYNLIYVSLFFFNLSYVFRNVFYSTPFCFVTSFHMFWITVMSLYT